MLEIYLWSPTDLKPWLCLFGVISALPVAFLLIRWRLKKSLEKLEKIASANTTADADSRRIFRQAAKGINPNPTDTLSLLSRMPRPVQIGFISLSIIVVCLIFITVPAYLLADHHLTAKVAVVNPDNTAFTRQIFIWDTTYGTLPGKGSYIVNRADIPVVILSMDEREVTDPVYIDAGDNGLLTGTPTQRTVAIPGIDTEVPPHTITKVHTLPTTYIEGMTDTPTNLPDFAGDITPLPVYHLMYQAATAALTPHPITLR